MILKPITEILNDSARYLTPKDCGAPFNHEDVSEYEQTAAGIDTMEVTDE